MAVGERDALGADGWILGDAFCIVNRLPNISDKKYRLAGGYGVSDVLGLTDGLTLAILVFSAVSSH